MIVDFDAIDKQHLEDKLAKINIQMDRLRKTRKKYLDRLNELG